MTQATATIVTQATPMVQLGQTAADTASVTGLPGGPAPTGTVTFTVFGPNDGTCAGPPVFTSANRPLAGGPPTATATSEPFTPAAPGTYRWVATYGGDASYATAATACNDPNETTEVIAVADLSVTKTCDPGPVAPGAVVSCSITATATTSVIACTITGAGDVPGTEGDDVICGSNGPDRIAGLGGNGVIFGLGGNDELTGGPGDDTLLGGDGNDRLTADAGTDAVFGGPGDDRLVTVDLAGGDLADGGDEVLGDLCAVDAGDTVVDCDFTSSRPAPAPVALAPRHARTDHDPADHAAAHHRPLHDHATHHSRADDHGPAHDHAAHDPRADHRPALHRPALHRRAHDRPAHDRATYRQPAPHVRRAAGDDRRHGRERPHCGHAGRRRDRRPRR